MLCITNIPSTKVSALSSRPVHLHDIRGAVNSFTLQTDICVVPSRSSRITCSHLRKIRRPRHTMHSSAHTSRNRHLLATELLIFLFQTVSKKENAGTETETTECRGWVCNALARYPDNFEFTSQLVELLHDGLSVATSVHQGNRQNKMLALRTAASTLCHSIIRCISQHSTIQRFSCCQLRYINNNRQTERKRPPIIMPMVCACVRARAYPLRSINFACTQLNKYGKNNILSIVDIAFSQLVLNVVCFLLGNSPASEFYMPTFRNTLFHLHKQVGVE